MSLLSAIGHELVMNARNVRPRRTIMRLSTTCHGRSRNCSGELEQGELRQNDITPSHYCCVTPAIWRGWTQDNVDSKRMKSTWVKILVNQGEMDQGKASRYLDEITYFMATKRLKWSLKKKVYDLKDNNLSGIYLYY